MIDRFKKFIFVHIPKCAGTSIERCLFPNHKDTSKTNYDICYGWDNENKVWMQHATALQIKKYYCDNYDDYFKFTITRNPWERAVSDYFWQKKELKINDSFKNFLLLEGNFNDDRLKFPPKDKSTRFDHTLPQSDFIFDEKDNNLVNLIGTMETIQDDFDFFCHEVGIQSQLLPHKNKTNHKHYSEYYNKETRDIVYKKYERDIDLFGHKFG